MVTESNKKYIDKNNKVAIIPVGFAVSKEEGEQVIDDGLVIKDLDGNEFVWIPVTGSNIYVRNFDYPNNFYGNIKNDIGYLPEGIEIGEPTGEKTLEDLTLEKEKKLVTEDMIKKYGVGGFYISKYEAGDGSASSNRTSAVDGTLVSKKDAYVYSYIKQTNDGTESGVLGAKEKAKKFINNEYVKSGLCTGIQWDMVMKFVDGKNDGEENPYLVETESDSRHHKGGVEQSGQNIADKVCNIYDLEGNCNEYVAEKNTYSTDEYPYVNRGGPFYGSLSASRRNLSGNITTGYISFRFVLYIM